MKKLVKICAASLVLTPTLSWALGLGNIEVQSTLNEPLSAEIGLIYSDSSEAAEATVALASAADFERVDLDISQLPAELQFAIVRNDQGNYVIQVSSREVIDEPFLDFLIEVSWPNGRLLREYVILLDPPVTAPSSGAAQTTPLSDPDPVTPTDTIDDSASTASTPSTSSSTTTTPSSDFSGSSSTTYGPVADGDTLWEIARDWRPSEDVSINQMMVMLLQNNPEAFFQDNVNALKSGAILRLPDQTDFDRMDESSATLAVRDQNELWQTYARTRTSTPTVSDAGLSSEYADSSTRDSGSRADSRLEIVPPGTSSDNRFDQPGSSALQAEADDLRNELSRVREELITASQENSELNSRVSELEGLVESLERALTLKDDALANLQAQQALQEDNPNISFQDLTDALGGDTAADDTTADTSFTDDQTSGFDSSASDDTTTGLDQTGFDSTVDDQTQDTQPATSTIDTVADTSTQPDSDTSTSQTDTTQTVPPVTRAPEPSLIDKAMDLLIPWGAAGLGGLLALLGGFVFWRRQQAAEEDRAEFTLPEVPQADEEDTGLELPAIDAESLQAAVNENPSDAQSHLALIRTHYASGDKAAFVAAAQAMRSNIDESHPAWVEVRNMSANLAPDVDLFEGTAEVDQRSEEVDLGSDLDLDFELEGNEVSNDAQDDVHSEPDLELDLGDLDFDADDADSSADTSTTVRRPVTEETEILSSDDDDDSLDFDLSLDEPEDNSDDATTLIRTPFESELKTEEVDQSDDDDDLDLGLDFDLDDVDISLDDDDTTETESNDSVMEDSPETALELAVESSEQTAETQEQDDMGDLEFDLEDLGLDLEVDGDDEPEIAPKPEAAEEVATEAEAVAMTDNDTDLQLEQDAQPEEDIFSELGLDDLDMEVGLDDGDDDVGTKLDLAKAYIDMGDPDGAKGMLEEVIEEGSSTQKEEAQKLLGEL